MKNFIFLSPNFPENYWQFCHHLKNNGIRVLGIGDCPYDNLLPQLKEALTEYYKVNTLESYDEVYRAVAFFSYKYGKIDYLESNNEYWLEQNAMLRTDFNIKSGFNNDDIQLVKFKSLMKQGYEKAGIKVARYHLVDNIENTKKFAEEVGYPIVIKPDNGVGASGTHKIRSDEQLANFFATEAHPELFIAEEFINATVNSYDAIVDNDGNPMFESGNITITDLLTVVNNKGDSMFYIVKDLAEDIRDAGRRTLKAFNVKNRFVHFEFFRLNCDQYIGKKGDVVALEVNMRPGGGVIPDMLNYANNTDVYEIWADMIAYGQTDKDLGNRSNCAFFGRRDSSSYKLSNEEFAAKYADKLKSWGRVPVALSEAMGDTCFIGCFDTVEEVTKFASECGEAPVEFTVE